MPHKPVAAPPTAATAQRLPTFRARLMLSLLGVVLLLTAALLAGQVYTSARLIRRTIQTIATAHLNHDQALVGSYFDDAQRQLFAAEHWAQAGGLSPEDSAGAARLLMPLCDSTVQVSAAFLSDCQGTSLTLRRSKEGWESIKVDAAHPSAAQFTLWPEPHNEPGRSWVGVAPDNTEANRLCRIGSSPDTVHWTGLIEDGPGGPGLMVAKALRHPGAGSLVLAFEISLWDLDSLLDRMHPTPHGYAVLLDAQSGLLERNPPPEEAALAEELEEPEILEFKQRLLELARQQPELQPALNAGRPYTASPLLADFRVGSARWWAAATPLNLSSTVWGSTSTIDFSGSANLVLLAFLPESDLFSELSGQRYLLLGIAVTVLLIALLLGNRIARSFSLPLAALAEQSQRIQRLELAPAPPLNTGAGVREIAQLVAAQDSMRHALESFARYVPVRLVRELLERDEAAQIGGRTALLTVLITDLQGFVAFCEEMPARELTAQLGEYFECLLTVLDAGGATVDKFVGDSVISFWGAPHPDPQQAEHAVATALRAAEALDELNARWLAQGKRQLQTKMGITQGDVVVGNVGASWRLNYTALGDPMNLASRLQQLNPRYGTKIIVNDTVRQSAGAQFAWRLLDRVEIRGRRMREDIFEPLAPAGAASPELRAFTAQYEQALQCYWSGEVEQGQALLAGLLAQRPADPSLLLLQHHLQGWHD
jgi:class 3 adenylate cyclase